MTSHQPGFTVVIPTRERSDVLRQALRTVTAQCYADLEILVSDNFSADNTRDVVMQVDDNRIRYINPQRRVSMSKNWEFALSHVASDRYVMVIGDDDGLLPGALQEVAALITRTGADAISAEFATFIWPNAATGSGGRLLVPMGTNDEIRNSHVWLGRALAGRAWYSELPMLYAAGAVRMSLLDDIRTRLGGLLFGSSQPDIFTAVTLAATTQTYAFSQRPFAIAGHSRHSNGAAWASHASGASDGAAPNDLFTSEENIPWHHSLPVYASGRLPLSHDLLVYESYLQSLDLHHDPHHFTPQRELSQLLTNPRHENPITEEWLGEFAARHRLSFARAKKDAWQRLPSLSCNRLVRTLRAFRDLYRVDATAATPLDDVYQASLLASQILRDRPDRVANWGKTIRTQITKHLHS